MNKRNVLFTLFLYFCSFFFVFFIKKIESFLDKNLKTFYLFFDFGQNCEKKKSTKKKINICMPIC